MKQSPIRVSIVLLVIAGCLFCPAVVRAQPLVKICRSDNCQTPVEGQKKSLLTDFDQDGVYVPFVVKGVGYAPTPIGKFYAYGEGWQALCEYMGPVELAASAQRFITPAGDANYFDCNGRHLFHDVQVLETDFALIQEMGANTVRTWGPVTPEFLKIAHQYDLKVIAGFWIDHFIDFANADPQPIIAEFLNYVDQYHQDSAILMWGLSNENNISFCGFAQKQSPSVACDPAEQARAFVGLLNEITAAAKERFPNIQPIMPVFAELHHIKGLADKMPNIDVVGVNSYRGTSFGDLFAKIAEEFPLKPMLITEFGFDAWDSQAGQEDQGMQAELTRLAWQDIERHLVRAGGNNLGGVVFVYSDAWDIFTDKMFNANTTNGHWTPSVAHHDTGFIVFPDGTPWSSGQRDARFNIEWAGIVALERDPAGGLDIRRPRQVYQALQEVFAKSLTADTGQLPQSPAGQ